jgi:hypothetical protein
MAAEFVAVDPERHEVDVLLPGDLRLTGTVVQVRDEKLTRVGFSRLSAKHRLAAWVELLALTATDQSRPWQAVVVGARGRSVLGPVSASWATQVLADLIELRGSGSASRCRSPPGPRPTTPPSATPVNRWPASSAASWRRPGRWTATSPTSSTSGAA